jgi:preprotein translocase subunit Sec63
VTRALLLLLVAILLVRVVRAMLDRSRVARKVDSPPPAWDPHAVLGVTRGESSEEITRAYREQLKRYHPDRVADLGPELQQVAHRKTVELQRAYGELTR